MNEVTLETIRKSYARSESNRINMTEMQHQAADNIQSSNQSEKPTTHTPMQTKCEANEKVKKLGISEALYGDIKVLSKFAVFSENQSQVERLKL